MPSIWPGRSHMMPSRNPHQREAITHCEPSRGSQSRDDSRRRLPCDLQTAPLATHLAERTRTAIPPLSVRCRARPFACRPGGQLGFRQQVTRHCHEPLPRRRSCKQESPVMQGFPYGRCWARTSDPQLVDSGQRSDEFAPVLLHRIVEPNLLVSERPGEPERTTILAILATDSP